MEINKKMKLIIAVSSVSAGLIPLFIVILVIWRKPLAGITIAVISIGFLISGIISFRKELRNIQDKLKTKKYPEPTIIPTPILSDWKCYLFGNKPGGNGITYMPTVGNVPNVFIRWMMKICFACTWVKEE